MKKIVLLALGGLLLAEASHSQNRVSGLAKEGIGHTTTAVGNANAHASVQKKTRKPLDAFPSTAGTKERTGNSTYDLQTNGSMQRRVLTSGNTVSACWTYSSEGQPTAASAFADRGTGYAHFDGTNWSPAPTARLEPGRTGFGSMVFDGNGNEVIVTHEGTGYTLPTSKKVAGSWTTNPLSLSASKQAIWPHVATSGNWMYVVAASQDSLTKSNGIRFGYFFSRSNDNGATWIDNMIPMPLIDSVGHYRGGGNSYAVSANGSNVAVLFGDLGTDLTLLSSTDNGATWSKKVIWDWPLNNYDFAGASMTDTNADNIPDTLFSNDGSQSMAMDAAGQVHIAFPLVRVYKSGANTGYNFFYTTSLLYYNSIGDSLQVVDNIFELQHDCDDDGIFGIGQNYTGTAANDPDAIYNSIGLITQPSISIVNGAPQKILIAYTAIMDGDTTIDDGVHLFWAGTANFEGQNYRDVFVAVSPDNGASWNPFSVNISKTSHFEEAFVSTPELVTGADFNVLYQGDIEPGTIMQNDDIYDDVYKNMYIVQKIPVSQLLTLSLDSTAPCGQFDLALGIKHVVNGDDGIIGVYPNPVQHLVNLSMKFVNTSSKVDIQILNLSGNQLQSRTLNQVNEATTSFDTKNLPAGFYIIKVTTEEGTIIRRFLKE
jgi:phosphoribosyl-AMP cyclohydrolase